MTGDLLKCTVVRRSIIPSFDPAPLSNMHFVASWLLPLAGLLYLACPGAFGFAPAVWLVLPVGLVLVVPMVVAMLQRRALRRVDWGRASDIRIADAHTSVIGTPKQLDKLRRTLSRGDVARPAAEYRCGPQLHHLQVLANFLVVVTCGGIGVLGLDRAAVASAIVFVGLHSAVQAMSDHLRFRVNGSTLVVTRGGMQRHAELTRIELQSAQLTFDMENGVLHARTMDGNVEVDFSSALCPNALVASIVRQVRGGA